MIGHTERLLKILNLLRNRRTVFTAQDLAEKLGVSTRTIYRDMQKLEAAGIPVEGEAGVGYRVQRRFDLPPLMFDADEVEALILGVKMVRAWSDQGLAASANAALNKIVGILPPELKDLENTMALDVPQFSAGERSSPILQRLRSTIKTQQVLKIQYISAQGAKTRRRIWPLGVFFWGHVWTLVAWCLKRGDYRVFRVDRIEIDEVETTQFEPEPSQTLEYYLARVRVKEHNVHANIIRA